MDTNRTTTNPRTIPATMIWRHKHYDEYGCLASCQCCGRAVSAKAAYIIVCDGGASLVHPEDADSLLNDGGFMGCFPVGSECAKKIPAEYLTTR